MSAVLNLSPSRHAVPTVYIVDDEHGVCQSMSILLRELGLNTVAYDNPADFLADIKRETAGVVILDIRMPSYSGIEVQQSLKRVGALMPVIFVTAHGDVQVAVEALKHGAFEFLEKPVRPQDLIDRVNQALTHDARTRKALAAHEALNRLFAALTPRETQVMDKVSEGMPNKLIAYDLGLSERTVEIHRAHVMQKLGVRSVAQLVRMRVELACPSPPLTGCR